MKVKHWCWDFNYLTNSTSSWCHAGFARPRTHLLRGQEELKTSLYFDVWAHVTATACSVSAREKGVFFWFAQRYHMGWLWPCSPRGLEDGGGFSPQGLPIIIKLSGERVFSFKEIQKITFELRVVFNQNSARYNSVCRKRTSYSKCLCRVFSSIVWPNCCWKTSGFRVQFSFCHVEGCLVSVPYLVPLLMSPVKISVYL